MLRKINLVSGAGVGLVLLLCVVRPTSQAEDLLLVPPELRPTNGLFYSFQHPEHPPLPLNLFPELPLYWVENDSFLVDDKSVDYESLRVLSQAFPTRTVLGSRSMSALASTNCGVLTVPVLSTWSNMVWTFSVQAPEGAEVDVFGSYGLGGPSLPYWYCLGRATNGQVFTVTNGSCGEGFFMAGCTNDTDGDGLTDAYELLVTKTSPTNDYSVNALYTDAEMENVLVNDLREDCGNEQNTQFETTCVVSGTNIIVAWVDSNMGVYSLGQDPDLTNYTPQFVAYAVSTDGGKSFHDRGVPPKSLQASGTADDGDAGDPVLAVDRSSGDVYLMGTSARNDGNHGFPLWKSADGGMTFWQATNVLDEIQKTDKPWLAVDDWPGVEQHDVYVVGSKGRLGSSTNGIWLTVSSNGWMTNWSAPFLIRDHTSVALSGQGAIPVVGSNHTVYMFWFETEGLFPNNTNRFLRMRQVSGRGTVTGEVYTVAELVTTGWPNGNLALKRSNTALTNTDTFKVPTLPVPAVSPIRTGHLYVAYADVGTNGNDKGDVFLTWSTDSGANWTTPQRVNMDATTNDQWMPMLAVQPDGEQLFMGWYDRRNDTNNGLMEVYGLFAGIEMDGSVDLTNALEFRISTTSFSMSFVGARGEVEPVYTQPGYYDPVYPPGLPTVTNSLTWWYPEWPPSISSDGVFVGHVGEYNGAFANPDHVYMCWTDYRLHGVGSLVTREQSDVRFVRIPWP